MAAEWPEAFTETARGRKGVAIFFDLDVSARRPADANSWQWRPVTVVLRAVRARGHAEHVKPRALWLRTRLRSSALHTVKMGVA